MSEFSLKQQRIQALLDEQELDALLLQRTSSFAWATCGAASYVNTAVTTGEASLLITRENRHLVTNNIEAPRLEHEEELESQEWEFSVAPWYEERELIAKLSQGMKLGADGTYPGAVDLSQAISRLRSQLTPQEGARFRALGRICAAAMDVAIRAVRPGWSEYEIAARLALEAESRGAQAIVNLIATDERIFDFRHPLPTDKALEKYAMLVLCGRRRGLVCSITRLVHFGALPDELRAKMEAAALVDATLIGSTRPGASLNRIFERAAATYADAGFPDEWKLHHQGGPAGYEAREIVATPTTDFDVQSGQAYAWNPSITGTKSEDTILVGEVGNEVITAIDGWPTLEVSVDGQRLARPLILEI